MDGIRAVWFKDSSTVMVETADGRVFDVPFVFEEDARKWFAYAKVLADEANAVYGRAPIKVFYCIHFGSFVPLNNCSKCFNQHSYKCSNLEKGKYETISLWQRKRVSVPFLQ